MLGGWARFLELDPAFLRRHPKALALVEREHDPALAAMLAAEASGTKPQVVLPYRLPTMDELEKRCRKHEQGWIDGYLRASTDPTSRVAVDGRDTGLMTPILSVDKVTVGAGKHRVTFSTSAGSVDVEVVVPALQNVCVYRNLPR